MILSYSAVSRAGPGGGDGIPFSVLTGGELAVLKRESMRSSVRTPCSQNPTPYSTKFFQFAHVAGPRVGLESVHEFGGDPVGAAPFAAERLEEMGHQQPDVALPLPERGHEQGDHVQPEEQVFTERPCATSSRRFLLLAAMMRMSTLWLTFPPTRRTTRSCKTRSSLT